MSWLRSLGMDNGSWLQAEPLNCEPLAQTPGPDLAYIPNRLIRACNPL